MSSCWRCGKPTPDGVIECQTHNSVNITQTPPHNWKAIDWNKVNDINDMKRIFAVLRLRFLVGGPEWEQLREFLED